MQAPARPSSTDAENNVTIHTGKDQKIKTRWDHNVLKLITTQTGAVTVESCSLSPDGTISVSVVSRAVRPGARRAYGRSGAFGRLL